MVSYGIFFKYDMKESLVCDRQLFPKRWIFCLLLSWTIIHLKSRAHVLVAVFINSSNLELEMHKAFKQKVFCVDVGLLLLVGCFRVSLFQETAFYSLILLELFAIQHFPFTVGVIVISFETMSYFTYIFKACLSEHK